MKLGVSLFSYQEAYYLRHLSLDGCLAAAKRAGGEGIELLVDQMIPGYPSAAYNLDERFVAEWETMLDRHQVEPVGFDFYGESKLYRHRPTSDADLTRQLIDLIRTGRRLGFRIFRLNFLVPLGVIEALVPHAEEMGAVMAIEVHASYRLSDAWVQGTLDIAARLRTRNLGIMPDFGIYCRSVPGRVLAEARRKGVRETVIDMAVDAYPSPGLRRTLVERVERIGGNNDELWLAKRVELGIWIDDDLRDLETYLPHIVHAHAKFYEVTEDLVEPEVRYEEIIPILVRNNYAGYVMSEYEGQRLNQGIDPGYDEIEQVRRHQLMLRRLIADSEARLNEGALA